ncbi:MAG: cytochrome c oxidase subunit II [Rhodospirillales bacterium]|nr:cytochrome c oxidase subunit II [Rhodospirillales bacterium]
MLLAIVLVILAVGSVIFHFMSPWWFTPIASNWGSFDDAINITFVITGVVYTGVILFMAYCLYRYRYRADRRAEYDPENTKLEVWLTGLTSVGVVALLTPGLLAWNDFVTVPKDATEIEVVGKQWAWSFRLPGKDGVLGTTNIRNMNGDNEFGVNPKDSAGKDDILIPDGDLHMPIGKSVKMVLRATDVLHDFYVPQFRAKMDMVPGMITYYWMTPTRTGTFDILCAEYCGVGHHEMRGKVVVDTPEDYQKWLVKQSTFAQAMAKIGKDTTGAVKMAAEEPRPDAAAIGAAR